MTYKTKTTSVLPIHGVLNSTAGPYGPSPFSPSRFVDMHIEYFVFIVKFVILTVHWKKKKIYIILIHCVSGVSLVQIEASCEQPIIYNLKKN